MKLPSDRTITIIIIAFVVVWLTVIAGIVTAALKCMFGSLCG
jgi:hypothetical protein